MNKLSLKILFLLLPVLFVSSAAQGNELSGFMEYESRIFFHDPKYRHQQGCDSSIALQPEYYHEWENGSSFIFVPFGRFDSTDSERTHFDIRELNYLWLGDDWELRAGVGKVFWGTTEFVHLVDIINQTDLVENIDEEEKLGQPMFHLSVPRDWGVVDMFVLLWFRERTFPGQKGRLRTALEVDTDKARYQSSTEEHHPDFALRYSNTLSDCDFGIYHFMGTGREPLLHQEQDDLIPYYEQINQTGLDVQYVAGEWLWKLESLYRNGRIDNIFATVFGFEYTFVGLADSRMDLGVIGEYAYDERDQEATTIFQNDIMVGTRLTANDQQSSELLVGLVQDVDNSAHALSVEASRRIGSNCKLILEAWTFINSPKDDPLASAQRDDFLRLQLAFYF